MFGKKQIPAQLMGVNWMQKYEELMAGAVQPDLPTDAMQAALVGWDASRANRRGQSDLDIHAVLGVGGPDTTGYNHFLYFNRQTVGATYITSDSRKGDDSTVQYGAEEGVFFAPDVRNGELYLHAWELPEGTNGLEDMDNMFVVSLKYSPSTGLYVVQDIKTADKTMMDGTTLLEIGSFRNGKFEPEFARVEGSWYSNRAWSYYSGKYGRLQGLPS